MYNPHVQSSFLVWSSRPLSDSPIQRLLPWCSHIVIESCCVSQSNMKPLTALRRQCDSSTHMFDIEGESSLISGDTRLPPLQARVANSLLPVWYGNSECRKNFRQRQACGLTRGPAVVRLAVEIGWVVAPFSKP